MKCLKMDERKIYIVASYTDTWPGRLIILRAKLKFWNRYIGDTYSHISIATDPTLRTMYSFARRTRHNPFYAGLIQENIQEGMFSQKPQVNRMAVFEYAVTEEQYQKLTEKIGADWRHRDGLQYNFLGITLQLLFGCGAARKNHYFCSQWVATLLNYSGIDLFHKNAPCVRPFDFYAALKDDLIYEGLVKDYCPDLSGSMKGAC